MEEVRHQKLVSSSNYMGEGEKGRACSTTDTGVDEQKAFQEMLYFFLVARVRVLRRITFVGLFSALAFVALALRDC